MDLRVFFQKVRKVEQEIAEPHVVIVSNETPDGGKAGIKSEVSRAIAARMIVEAKARLAQPEEAQEYCEELRRSRESQQLREQANKVNLALLKDEELEALRHAMRKKEK